MPGVLSRLYMWVKAPPQLKNLVGVCWMTEASMISECTWSMLVTLVCKARGVGQV
jgi:hypothetical protein